MEHVASPDNMLIEHTTIVTTGPAGAALEIFGAAADQIAPMPGRVSVEIQNRSGADIEISTTETAANGRLIADGNGWSVDLSDDWQGNIYIVVGAGTICVTQIALADN